MLISWTGKSNNNFSDIYRLTSAFEDAILRLGRSTCIIIIIIFIPGSKDPRG